MAHPADLTKAERLVSLDAFRGFTMLAMASGGLGLSRVAEHFPDSQLWSFLDYQSSHVHWVGCAAWDLIQPAFMFMVGASMPYSYGRRKEEGDSFLRLFGHAIFRAFVLTALGVFLYSNGARQTNFIFPNVLAQIGLGYAFVFLVVGRRPWLQLLAVVGILSGYWFLFYQHPLPGPGFDFSSVGVEKTDMLPGLFAHWSKNVNFASAFDQRFLNWFPRAEPFHFNGGGYQTLNFVPSMATMIFGVMAGELLRSTRTSNQKLARLWSGGLVLLSLGVVAGVTVCPIVKRIWTPSWALFSGGWVVWFLAAFYWLVDIQGWKRLAFPLVVVGMNSLVIYMMDSLAKGWVAQSLKTHLGTSIFSGTFGPLVEQSAILATFWLVCLWLYRQRIFVRI